MRKNAEIHRKSNEKHSSRPQTFGEMCKQTQLTIKHVEGKWTAFKLKKTREVHKNYHKSRENYAGT